jgi:hypothetical protein
LIFSGLYADFNNFKSIQVRLFAIEWHLCAFVHAAEREEASVMNGEHIYN